MRFNQNYLFVFGLFFVTILVASNADETEKPKKTKPEIKELRIGIKKRAAECKERAQNGDSLQMHYTGTLYEDGSKFDSSLDRGDPFTFTLGQGMVIQGWDRGLIGMCVGEKRRLTIPSELGYGASGSPPKIPANAALVFEVELLKIDRKDEL